MFSKNAFSTLTLIGVVALSGCATIVDGTTQSVKIDSNPEGAKVYTAIKVTKEGGDTILKKQEVGVTPITVTIPRKDGAVFVEKDGYDPEEVPLKRGTNSWIWGDVALGSLLSTSIDTSTGASNEYDPGDYMIELKPAQTAQPAQAAQPDQQR